MKIKQWVLGAVISTFALTCFAEVPPAPTAADVATTSACIAYSNQMDKWASEGSTSADLYNSMWFEGFASTSVIYSGSQSCTNNVCTNYYWINSKGYGTATGCVLAGTASESAKTNLLTILTDAYNLAMNQQKIISTYGYNSYGLYGSSNSCTPTDNYAGCQFYNKK